MKPSISSRDSTHNFRLVVITFLTCCFIILAARFYYPNTGYLSFFTDDFYYYIEIAKNIVKFDQSSFDLVEKNNGYHPLWMIVMIALIHLFDTDLSFFIAATLIIFLLVGVYFHLTQKILSVFEINPYLSLAIAMYNTLFMLVLSRTGMEISLALVLLAGFIYWILKYPYHKQTQDQAFFTGLLAAFACLARLDTLLLTALFFTISTLACNPLKKQTLIRASVTFTGLTPILFYLYTNITYFKVLTPISGMAKHLKMIDDFSVEPLLRLTQLDALNIMFIWPCAVAISILLPYIIFSKLIFLQNRKILFITVLLHPIIFFALLAFESDWHTLTWYLYVFVIPLLIAAISLIKVIEKKLQTQIDNFQKIFLISSFALTLLLGYGLIKINPEANAILKAAEKIATFAENKPGYYAMGDRAGMPAFLIEHPILQLEGLVAGKSLLQDIKKQRNLMEVLKEREVNYYIATDSKVINNCTTVFEPLQVGPNSPVMSATFCGKPEYAFELNGKKTEIFRVN